MSGPRLTKEHIDLIQSAKHSEVFKLKGIEVAAVFSLGQMHNKIVKLTDSMWKKVTVGLFYIDQINENHNLSFSNSADWQTVKIDSISMHLIIFSKSRRLLF
jgi:hypothetical protein